MTDEPKLRIERDPSGRIRYTVTDSNGRVWTTPFKKMADLKIDAAELAPSPTRHPSEGDPPPGAQLREDSFYKGVGRQPPKKTVETKTDTPGLAPLYIHGGTRLLSQPNESRPKEPPEDPATVWYQKELSGQFQKLACYLKSLRPEQRKQEAHMKEARMKERGKNLQVIVRNLRVKPGLNSCALCDGPVTQDLPVAVALDSRSVCDSCAEKYAKELWNLVKDFNFQYPSYPAGADSEAALAELARKLDSPIVRLDQRTSSQR